MCFLMFISKHKMFLSAGDKSMFVFTVKSLEHCVDMLFLCGDFYVIHSVNRLVLFLLFVDVY